MRNAPTSTSPEEECRKDANKQWIDGKCQEKPVAKITPPSTPPLSPQEICVKDASKMWHLNSCREKIIDYQKIVGRWEGDCVNHSIDYHFLYSIKSYKPIVDFKKDGSFELSMLGSEGSNCVDHSTSAIIVGDNVKLGTYLDERTEVMTLDYLAESWKLIPLSNMAAAILHGSNAARGIPISNSHDTIYGSINLSGAASDNIYLGMLHSYEGYWRTGKNQANRFLYMVLFKKEANE